MEKEKKIMIWFKVYDLMYMYANDVQKDDFNSLVDKVDIFYAADKESYQSACERAYENQVRMLPEEIDNTEDAEAYIRTDMLLESDITNLDIISPERMKTELLGEEANKGPMAYSQMNNDMRPMTPQDLEEAAEKLPGRIGEQLKGLMGAIDEVNENASEIFARYAQECDNIGVGKDQAKQEAELYMKGNIPASEFVAPVAILDNLKKL